MQKVVTKFQIANKKKDERVRYIGKTPVFYTAYDANLKI